MTYDAGLFTLATTGMTLFAALVVAMAPVLMAALVTFVADRIRGLPTRPPALRRAARRAPALAIESASTSHAVAPRPAA